MRNKLLLILLVMFIYNNVAAEDITFNQALEKMYSTHEGISQAEAEYKQKNYIKKAALGLYSPRIYLNGAYTYFGNDLVMDVDLSPLKNGIDNIIGSLPPLPLPLPPVHIPETMEQVVQKDQFFTLDATLIWPVFTGGKIFAANKAASAGRNIAKYAVDARYDELGASMAEKYFTLRFIQDVIALKSDVVTSMQNHYNKALKLEKAGMLAKVERLHAEMSLSEAEKSLENSIREARLAESALKSMIDSTSNNIKPSTPLFIIDEKNVEELIYFQDMALVNNAKLKQAREGKNIAKAGTINSISSFVPKINVFGNANLYNYQLSSMSPDYMIGVQMTFNVFDGLQNYHSLKASKASEESVKLLVARAEKDIKTLVEQQYIIMENARADYNSSLKSLAFTEEYLRARRKAFNQGMATSLDVVDAELALSNAKLSAITAAYKFDIALITMLSTSGLFDNFENYRAKAFVEPALN